MSDSNAVSMPQGSDIYSIIPYKITIPQRDLDDLKQRLANTRWPDELPDAGWDYGIPLDYTKELATYWGNEYDWRKQEAMINQFPQFVTVIDGQTIHFIHVRSSERNAMPLILTHGWPGSFVEFLKVIEPLTNPRAYGGNAADAFDVIIPSIPGFGFSGPTHEKGWDVKRVAQAWIELMRRLGYDRYGAHGGDWGSIISREIGLRDADHVAGIHLTMMSSAVPDASTNLDEIPNLSDAERQSFRASMERRAHFNQDELGYGFVQSTRPQTLAYSLTDSPVGQLAWLGEKFKEWTDCTNYPEDAIDRDHMLTNISVYWLTRTAGSAARLYYETAHLGPAWGTLEESSETPTGLAVFPHDTSLAVRQLAERNNNVVHWSKFDKGGHFAAMEVPDLLVGDIRDFFRSLR